MVDAKDKIFGIGVVLLVLNKDMTKILMLKRNKEKRKRWGYTWGNVGGVVEKGEYLIDACLRETREEIGLVLDKKDIKFISIKETPDFLPNVHAIHFFYFTTIDDKAKVCLNCESEGCTWFDINKLPKDVIDKNLGKLIKLAEKYEKEIMEPKLRPEYIEKLKQIKKQKHIPFKHIAHLRKIIGS